MSTEAIAEAIQEEVEKRVETVVAAAEEKVAEAQAVAETIVAAVVESEQSKVIDDKIDGVRQWQMELSASVASLSQRMQTMEASLTALQASPSATTVVLPVPSIPLEESPPAVLTPPAETLEVLNPVSAPENVEEENPVPKTKQQRHRFL